MSHPIEEIGITCPGCGHHYKDWQRTVGYLDDFDENYLDVCRSATCPQCQHKVALEDWPFFDAQALEASHQILLEAIHRWKADQSP